MLASQVAALQGRAVERGIDLCVVGGWGVDALLGAATREHNDLDVLLPLTALHESLSFLAEEGFRLAYMWEESRGIAGHHRLVGESIPSAFVVTHPDGREVDIHVYQPLASGLVCLWDTDRALVAEDLAARGEIDGAPVRCMTAAMQLTCHRGYDLPPAHAADVGLLQRLVRGACAPSVAPSPTDATDYQA